jgi:TP901 family phage tail tape measure protein
MAATTIDELQVLISAQTASFNSEINKVRTELGQLEGASSKTNSAVSALSGVLKGALVAGGVAAVAGIGAAIKTTGTFESSLSKLAQASGATGKEMDSMSELAKELGKSNDLAGVTASDAAESMVELAKAGLSVGDTMDATKGVMSLAKAGNMAFAEAATVAASALNAFGMKGADATRVADMLAAGANASQAELGDLAAGMQQSATVAKQFELGLQDTVTALALFANNGIKGSDAGTSLKTMLISLAKPSKESAEAMKDIGFEAYNAEGKFVGLEEMSKRLKKATEGLTDEQKQSTLATIFGTDAFRAAAVLADNAGDSYTRMSNSVGKVGAAQEAATAQMGPFQKATENMSNQLSDLGLTIGTILIPYVTAMAVAFGDFISSTNSGVPTLVAAITSLVNVSLALYEAVAPFIPAVLGLVAAYTAYQVIAGIVTGVQIALTGAMIAGTTANGAYALGIGAVTLAQNAGIIATNLYTAALSLLNPVTLAIAAAVAAVTLGLEAMKLAQANANLEAQNTLTFQERETELRLLGKDAIKAQEDALRSYTDAKAEQTNASLALMSAEDQQTAAAKRLDDMIRNGVDPASREYQRAQLELESANFRVRDAQDKVTGSQREAETQYGKVGDAVWAQIKASKEDELQKLAQAGKYDQVNQKLKDLATSTTEYKDANGQMTKFSAKDMEAMALGIGDSITRVNADYKKFWDASQESVDKAAQNVGQVQSKFTESGRSFSQGLANGINADAWRVESAATNTANRANAAYKKALDIHSPSRVMKKGGGYFSLGIAEGIKSKTAEVAAAARAISQTAVSSVDFSYDTFSANVPTSKQLSAKLDVAYDARLSEINTRQTPVNIDLDGQRLLSFVIDGVNGKSFMSNGTVLNI